MWIVRHSVAATAAWGITFGLFFGMQFLIAMGDAPLDDQKKTRVIDFVRVKRDVQVAEKKRELPDRPPPTDQPPPPEFKLSNPKGGEGAAPTMAIAAPKADFEFKMGAGPKLGARPGSRSRSEVPLVRINPQYPRIAAQDGVEGWVRVRFDINPDGQVRNVRVIGAKPRGVFEQATIRAIKKWKYRPKTNKGAAIWRRGVAEKITFNLAG